MHLWNGHSENMVCGCPCHALKNSGTQEVPSMASRWVCLVAKGGLSDYISVHVVDYDAVKERAAEQHGLGRFFVAAMDEIVLS